MIHIRRSAERGSFDHGWLQTQHTFAFGDYHDPAHVQFRSLRVMNEDRIQPGQGFGMHGHRDMEIITLVLAGAIEHQDSLGHGAVLRPGELQHMSAGTGIRHSEFNPSPTEPVHLYQVWLLPDRRGHPPAYEQQAFDRAARQGRWQLVASADGAEGSLLIHTDARLLLADLALSQELTHNLAPGRHAWLQVLRGRVQLGGEALVAGDGAALSDEPRLSITGQEPAELLLFDLA